MKKPVQRERGPWWCFTYNNPPVPYGSLPFDSLKLQYLCYQLERAPTTGTLHYQVVCQFMNKNTTRKHVMDMFGRHISDVKQPWTTPVNCVNYCQKADTRVEGPWIHGEMIKRGSHKRKLERLEAEYDEDPDAFHTLDPDLANRLEARRANKKFKEEGTEYDLSKMDRPWQECVKRCLAEKPDARTIHWVCGSNGSEGKTTFKKSLYREGWSCIRAGKLKDMQCSFWDSGWQKNLVIDVARSTNPDLFRDLYSMIENVKDGDISTSKYKSRDAIRLHHVHVVVLSNEMPDRNGLSKDRVRIHRIGSDMRCCDVDEKDYVSLDKACVG